MRPRTLRIVTFAWATSPDLIWTRASETSMRTSASRPFASFESSQALRTQASASEKSPSFFARMMEPSVYQAT